MTEGSKWVHIEITDYYELFEELGETPTSWRELFRIARERKLNTPDLWKIVRVAAREGLFDDKMPSDYNVFLKGGTLTTAEQFKMWKETIPNPVGDGDIEVREVVAMGGYDYGQTPVEWALRDDEEAIQAEIDYLTERVPKHVYGRMKQLLTCGVDVREVAGRLCARIKEDVESFYK